MKILHVVEPFASGVLMFVASLTNKQCRDDEVYVAHGIRPLTDPHYPELFDKRVHLIRVENFMMEINPLKEIRAVAEIRRLARQIRPDIVHMHSSKSGVIGRLALAGTGIPQFYSPHGFSFLMQNASKAKREVYRSIEALFARFDCTLVACSRGEHAEALKLSRKSLLVSNGIDLEELRPYATSAARPEGARNRVATVGRILFQKNPELFNQIASRLPDIEFLWIGDGEMRDCLTAPNIEITGWGNRDEALRMLSRADIFLLTSLWEGLPLALLEAMYLRKICVVSNVIGNRDVIRQGVNGFICNTADEFVEAIRRVTEGKTDREKMTACACEDVCAEYNTDVMYAGFRRLYEDRLA